ncbi:frigida-LIKE protein [Medicago truncatula]|uniref:FRIGIDA-like protein n=1 Tax=Medicago truncatula TaxID=3880 RepID=G7LCF3_MEDTR|nr:frigida-LIKE protein [Medicago truncatula]
MDFEASDNPKCDASVEKMDNTMLPVKRLFDNKERQLRPIKRDIKKCCEELENKETQVNELESKKNILIGRVKEFESEKAHFEIRMKEFESRENKFKEQEKEFQSKEEEFKSKKQQFEMPVAHHHRGCNVNTSGKGLRLFGFDIECDSSSPASPQATICLIIQQLLGIIIIITEVELCRTLIWILLIPNIASTTDPFDPSMKIISFCFNNCVRDEALKLAHELKFKIKENTKNSLEVLRFLLIITIYGLLTYFDRDDVSKLYASVAEHNIAVKVFRTLDFVNIVSRKLLIQKFFN